jgi:hypothetical protein
VRQTAGDGAGRQPVEDPPEERDVSLVGRLERQAPVLDARRRQQRRLGADVGSLRPAVDAASDGLGIGTRLPQGAPDELRIGVDNAGDADALGQRATPSSDGA